MSDAHDDANGAWAPLLRRWSRETLDRAGSDADAELPDGARQSGWLGAPGADAEALAALEQRLGRPLPPSYRAFLAATDGWWQPEHIVTRVYPAAEVDWLSSRSPETIEAWTQPVGGEAHPPVPDDEYAVYGEKQDPVNFRPEYLPDTLEVGSSPGGEQLLLNPRVTFPDGEWEVLVLAAWFPGANRYRSFREAMEELHRRFMEQD